MEFDKIVEVLRATLDPNQREQAEEHLKEVHKIIKFAPVLLQVLMNSMVDMPVRQAGVIYLKNMITQYWLEKEVENPGEPLPFSIHEEDRSSIRNLIIEAIIEAPDPIRVQLCVCFSHIVKHDFPGRWPNVMEKIGQFIQSDNHGTWMGAFLCLYQVIKVYEYKRPEERRLVDDQMQILLPVLYQRMTLLMQDAQPAAVLIQKQILKIFYAFVQNYLPLHVLTKAVFTQWMEIFRLIVDRDVPSDSLAVDEDERPALPWWKVKKWAVHILARVFERYGSPGNVTKEYTDFSEWYLKTFSCGIIQVLLKLLDHYRQKVYVAPRVVQQALNYINQGISHAISWKYIKGHMEALIKEVIFPLMCHSDEDEELWNSDPHEYIRVKYDVFEDFLSPVMAAQTVFYSAAAKRKEVLNKAMGFCMEVLNTQTIPPRQKDGALHMIGAVAEILLKRKIYKDQAEQMLATKVYPEFKSSHGFLRARACWVVRYFCELKFREERNLMQGLELVKECLCSDKDLPVRVEAAIALQMLITEQERAKAYIQPFVRPVILELLNVIRETENDDLTGVMQRLVCTYSDDVIPIAVDMMTHLAQTFEHVINSESTDASEDKAITALGILNTMETILNVMEDKKEIITELEGIVLRVIAIILNQNIMDFYEEVLSLIYSLTSTQVSHHMWDVFTMIYQMFQKDGIDYFTDMMPALHNYITVDTPAFLAKPQCMEMIFEMCKTVLSGEVGEDAECHAAKLLEVIILQCPGKIDQAVPLFVDLVLQRLTREVQTSELRTMCLQVVIAALYYNLPLLLQTLNTLQIPNISGSILAQFLKQWLHDADCFLGLHDRKISVLGLCSLINMPGTRPAEVMEVANQLIPASLLIFQGLKRAYASRALEDNSDDEDDDDENVDDQDILESDEDEVDEESKQYLEKLEKADKDDDSDAEYTDDGAEETALESYQTILDEEHCPVDEYLVFKTVLGTMQQMDPEWYNTIAGGLSPEQIKELDEVFRLADQRKAAADSKRIEEGGGYVFTQRQVPTTFNFGGQIA